jgi:hypothetical protein
MRGAMLVHLGAQPPEVVGGVGTHVAAARQQQGEQRNRGPADGVHSRDRELTLAKRASRLRVREPGGGVAGR